MISKMTRLSRPRVNVCINGTFRYPGYIRYYANSGLLNAFYYSHRVSTTASHIGIPTESAFNFWMKEYALHASLRVLRPQSDSALTTFFGDYWQQAVIRNWRDSDTVEAVIGEVADRVLDHAKRRGSRTVGHPVNSHPTAFADLINDEYDRLGLRWPKLRTSERRLTEISLCDHLIVDSRFVADSYLANGYPTDRISIVRPGADTNRFSARSVDELDRSVFRVISVGAMSPRKGHRYLLQAWQKLRLPNAELIVVGASTNATSSIVRGYEGTFIHHERIANAHLRPLLASASAFVLPSIEDGYSQAAIEALSCGVPTIVTQNNGVADVVDDGENGFVVPAQDPDAIAEKLQTLYDDPDRGLSIGQRAASTATGFGWEEYVDRVLGIHSDVLAR